MRMSGATNIGKQRKTNQDAYYLDEARAWCMVADGMGGHNGGETASRMAVEVIRQEMEESDAPVEPRMCDAIDAANQAIYQTSLSNPELSGMGTTVVLFHEEKGTAVITHAGDSRAYYMNEAGIWQVTTDHSIVQQLVENGTITPEEAKEHPQKNLITRAVGTDAYVDVDINRVSCSEGDVFLLCSDGLTSYVEDEQIRQVIAQCGIDGAPEELVRLANAGGGGDNITVVIVQI